MPNYIAIGDIHGMAQLLEELLAALPSEGELVFLGDYIDRGPDSNAVISRLIALAQERTCHFLRGNHEEMMLSALDGPNFNFTMRAHWMLNGGSQTLDSYDGHPLPPAHLAFLRQTRGYLSTEEYIFVHAGLLPGCTPEDTPPQHRLWIREQFLRSNYDWGRLVIHGHTPCKSGQPDIHPHRINIDTGAVYGGALTALVLPEHRFIKRRATPAG